MTKIASKVVTALAVLSLAAPAFAAGTAAPAPAAQHRVHRKVAQAETKGSETTVKTEKKVSKKHKAKKPAAASTTSPSAAAPAPAPAPAK